MSKNITIKEVPIEEAVKVNTTIVEFDASFQKDYFESRYKGKEKLIIVAYFDDQPAGYIVGCIRRSSYIFLYYARKIFFTKMKIFTLIKEIIQLLYNNYSIYFLQLSLKIGT